MTEKVKERDNEKLSAHKRIHKIADKMVLKQVPSQLKM